MSKGNGTFDEAKPVLAEFGINQGWGMDQHIRLLADLTSDGKADIIGFGNKAGRMVALGTGDRSFQPASFVPPAVR